MARGIALLLAALAVAADARFSPDFLSLPSGTVNSLASLLDELRAVRFRCGHCLCCERCADALVQRADGCPSCRTPIEIVGARGAHLAAESTFIAPL